MSKHLWVLVIAFACGATAAVQAQSLAFVRRTGGYASLGFGGGNFKLKCDSGCVGDQLTASDLELVLGRNFGRRGDRAPARLRAEIIFHFQRNSEFSSDVFTASAGASFYLVNNLYVRGGAAYASPSTEDATGAYKGHGLGFQAGAGYDFPVGRTFALSPYVTFTSASISNIDATALGGATGTTSGSLRALNFGVALTRVRGTYWCTTQSGTQVKVTRRNRDAALSCLAEVERRLSR